MTIKSPFMPHRGANQVVSPAAASASVSIPIGAKSVRFVNSGSNICYVRVGTGSQTASTADTPVMPGNPGLILGKFQDDDTVAYISASGTTLNIQPGEGGYV